VAFYAERFLRRHGLPTEGLSVTCAHAWAKDPSRVGEIRIAVEAPGLPPERREAFSRVIEHCPVHNTLRVQPRVRMDVVAAASAPAPTPG
jgi:putative redox protein